MKKIYTEFKLRWDEKAKRYYSYDEKYYWYSGKIVECKGPSAPSQPETTTTVQKSEPWGGQKPFLKKGFQRAEDLLLNQQPEYFQGSTVVPFSPETETALQLQTQRAFAGSPVQNAANEQLTSTLRGENLYGGPGFDRALEAAQNKIMPMVDSRFAQSGRFGSGLAQEAMARGIADQFAEQYGAERDRQMRASLVAPQIAAADYQDIAKLGEVGGARESLQAQQLKDEIARHNFQQNIQRQQLAQYLPLVSGSYGGTTTTTGPNPNYQPAYGGSPLMGGLGGAMSGYSMFGPIGALGGGLLGAFGF